MRIDHFKEWFAEIQDYCMKNDLDFEKVKKLSKGNGSDFLLLGYSDIDKGKKGLIDDTPAPLVLIIKKTIKGLVFEQTEYTSQYLM